MTETAKTMICAGGCFWCIEHDLRALPGVIDAVSGYAGVGISGVTYQSLHTGDIRAREAVQVTYDPTQISFRALVDFFCTCIDPTDPDGQFADRGYEYTPAVYYANESEKSDIESVIAELVASDRYEKPIVIAVEPTPEFVPAEEYHQNYSDKNPDHYARYRVGSGRESYVCRIREMGNE